MPSEKRQYRKLGLSWTAEEKREYNRQYYAARREAVKARARDNYHKNKELLAAKYRLSRHVILARARERRRVVGDKLRADQRRRYAKNPGP